MALPDKATFLQAMGSLWFAAVLILLLAVMMAAATIYESQNGTEQALEAFYRSQWFWSLAGLLTVNLIVGVLLRVPFRRQHIGFLATHLSVLLIFAGAIITTQAGIDGRLVISEGQTLGTFHHSDHPTLAVVSRSDRISAEAALDRAVYAGFEARSEPAQPPLICGDLQVRVRRYEPDVEDSRRIVDHQPGGKPAIEGALLSDKHEFAAWVFAGETAMAGELPVAFTIAASPEEADRWVKNAPQEEGESKGTVKVEYEGRTYAYPIEQCTEHAVQVGETGYSVRVTRYLPHAVVGQDKAIVSASSQPVNPYIEAELTGPGGTETRRAFSKFPEFNTMHGGKTAEAVKLSFETPQGRAPSAPVEVLATPDGRMFVRFSAMGGVVSTKDLALAAPIDTPWEGWKFVIRHRKEGAKWEQTVAPVTPPRREGREQAVLLALSSPGGKAETWAIYGRPTMVDVGGRPYEVRFDDATIAMGFELKLDNFRLITYPGSQKPRSFESHVTIVDPRAGGETSRVISMNHPLDYGGYTFYQSSYSRDEGGATSVLSVSRDPGRLIAFAGYIVLMAGMIWVLMRRMAEPKKAGPIGLSIGGASR